MPRIELNGEGEPVWLTLHLRDPQPEGERERAYQLCIQHYSHHFLNPFTIAFLIYQYVSNKIGYYHSIIIRKAVITLCYYLIFDILSINNHQSLGYY